MRVLAFPDLHIPYSLPAAFDFVSRLAKSFRPDVVVSMGDEADFASVSRWGTNPDLKSPSDEVTAIREGLQAWYRRFPVVHCCESNHNARPLKKASKAGLSSEFLVSIPNVLEAPPRWQWAKSWEFDGVVFEHGEGVSGNVSTLHALRNSYGKSVCVGHIHTKQMIDWHVGKQGRRTFACYAGCLIDPHSPAFSYAQHSTNRPCLGAVLIEDGVPTIVPLEY